MTSLFPYLQTLYDEPDQVMIISSLPITSVTPEVHERFRIILNDTLPNISTISTREVILVQGVLFSTHMYVHCITPQAKKFSTFTDLKTEMRRSVGLVAENEWPDSGVKSYIRRSVFTVQHVPYYANTIVNQSAEIEVVSTFLPPAYVVRGKVIFILGNVCLFTIGWGGVTPSS